jgi:hypothetical protein
MYNVNGPPKGSNVTSDQSSYDIVFKDIIVKSENRINLEIEPEQIIKQTIKTQTTTK